MTVRERLDALTAKLWTSIDQALDTTTPTPDTDSIAASRAAIDAAVTDRGLNAHEGGHVVCVTEWNDWSEGCANAVAAWVLPLSEDD